MIVKIVNRIRDPSNLNCKFWKLSAYAKFSAWWVLLQNKKLTDLAGIRKNGGTCGLMR